MTYEYCYLHVSVLLCMYSDVFTSKTIKLCNERRTNVLVVQKFRYYFLCYDCHVVPE